MWGLGTCTPTRAATGNLLEEMRAVASLADAVLDDAIIELRLEGA